MDQNEMIPVRCEDLRGSRRVLDAGGRDSSRAGCCLGNRTGVDVHLHAAAALDVSLHARVGVVAQPVADEFDAEYEQQDWTFPRSLPR
jgi:hypothetical protein